MMKPRITGVFYGFTTKCAAFDIENCLKLQATKV